MLDLISADRTHFSMTRCCFLACALHDLCLCCFARSDINLFGAMQNSLRVDSLIAFVLLHASVI